ncbi:MAG: hypothetical protein ACI8X5_003124 [Planctomycetota bacterium]|jgi:hypothetical protein
MIAAVGFGQAALRANLGACSQLLAPASRRLDGLERSD